MNKLIGCLIVMTMLPVALMVGCDSTPPAGPGGPLVATSTPTVTSTPTATGTPQGNPAMVNLGSAGNFVAIAYTQITNSGPSTLCGSLALFPGSQVDGGIVVICGGVREVSTGTANTAKTNLSTAYTDAAGRSGGALLPPGADIGGKTFYRGVYQDNGNLLVSSNDITLDAQGDPNAVFIFQVNGNLIASSGRQVFLIGGAKAANVFWQVTGYCALGTTVSFAGNIMCYTSVTMNTGAKLYGRALASNGNITLLTNTITKPAP